MPDSTTGTTQCIGVLLFDGFSNHCLANAVEPFRAANTFCGGNAYEWRFLTIDGNPATSSSGLPVVPHERLSEHPGGDFLLLLPSYGFLSETTHSVLSAIRAASRRFATLVGMDTGAWLLAAAGLLANYRATIHWDEMIDFAERFPDIDVVSDRCVIDRNRATCGGASTAFDLVLRLIQARHGSKLRMQVHELFVPGDSLEIGDLQVRPGQSTLLGAAIALMRTHTEDVLSIPQIGEKSGLHPRTMERLFRDELGLSPIQAYRYLRLNEARRLLAKTRLSIAEVALRCGYTNTSAMTRAFRVEFGVTPTAWRTAPSWGADMRRGAPIPRD